LQQKLKEKVLFVFSDPGGAKPILSLVEELNPDDCLAVSNRDYSFYSDFKTPVKITEKGSEEIINSYKPDLIFTGTSYPSDFDKQFIKTAIEKNIKCYTFVDHWTNMDLRFRLDDNTFLEPSQVWVIDERGKKIAMQAGILESKIIISGNPYHRWLKNWKPAVSKEIFLKSIGLKNNIDNLMVFAPDPLSNINGMEKYGFDELSALKDFIELFEEHQSELSHFKILIKAHPNQNRKKIQEVIRNNENFILLTDNINANTVMYYGNVIIGFFSSFLLEAKILGKEILRFMPVPIEEDPIGELNAGTIVNKESLLSYLLKQN
jgi:hypothetical protein